MCKTVSFKVSSGMDSAVRVMTTLRRKQFEVKGFSMKELEENLSELEVVLEDTTDSNSMERAILQMSKLVDVYDIKEVC